MFYYSTIRGPRQWKITLDSTNVMIRYDFVTIRDDMKIRVDIQKSILLRQRGDSADHIDTILRG